MLNNCLTLNCIIQLPRQRDGIPGDHKEEKLNYLPLRYLALNCLKKACAFIVRIEFPLQTLERIIQLLSERKILVESLQMHDASGGEAILILHCLLEKDRIKHSRHMLEKIQGAISVELLESR